MEQNVLNYSYQKSSKEQKMNFFREGCGVDYDEIASKTIGIFYAFG
jgi:hypothetical protein